MAYAADILTRKGSHVETIGPLATIYEAAVRMNEHKIGALAVIADEHLVGIITERDILQRVVAPRRDPADTFVEDVMTHEVLTCEPVTPIDEARHIMKDRRVRHLPVIDEDGQLCGLISIGDLNAYQTTTQEQTIHFLNEYIHGHAEVVVE